MSTGCGLTSDCIFSSAWQCESREGQTDKGRQSGGQRGTDRLSARQRHAQSPPQSHPDPPSHAQGSAAWKQLLRRSRWRTRWRPGTALIHELQHRKTQGVSALESSTQGLQVAHSWRLGSPGVEGSEAA